jgi:hypothetical protein
LTASWKLGAQKTKKKFYILYLIGLGYICLEGEGRDVKHTCQVITSSCSHIQTQSSKEIMREKKTLSLLLENTIRVGERTIYKLV